MNKTLKRLNVFLLLLVLVLAINQGIFFLFSVNPTTEKILCSATIDDDFGDETVLLALTNDESMKFKKYSISDFKEVDCASVEEITESLVSKIKKQQSGIISEDELIIDTTKFQRIFEITLKKKGKENILKAIKSLEQKKEIYCVEPNYKLSFDNGEAELISAYDSNYRDYWIEETNLNEARSTFDLDAQGIKVGIIDTGIGDHDALNCIDKSGLHKDFTGGNEPLNDVVGHGTFIAGIIGGESAELQFQGICKNVSLVSLKVGNTNKGINVDYVHNAVSYATDNNIPILNISLGKILETSNIVNLTFKNYPGLIICSAGNEITNTDDNFHYPSCLDYDNIISVGASNRNGEKYSKSNYGKTTVDLFAPGEDIFSTYSNNRYATASGTSYAAPMVTATAALLLGNYPNLSIQKLRNIILFDGITRNSCFNDLCVTNGQLNIYSAFNFHYYGHQYEDWYGKNINSNGTSDNFYHKAYCVCGDYILEKHSTPTGVTGNSAVCTKCGEEAHTHNYTSYYAKYGTNNRVNHKAYCSCGEFILESHVAPDCLTSHTEAPCAKCGEIDSFHYFTWVYYNNKNHIRACSCGIKRVNTNMPHIIARADIKNGRYAPCLDCGTVLDLLYDQALVKEF